MPATTPKLTNFSPKNTPKSTEEKDKTDKTDKTLTIKDKITYFLQHFPHSVVSLGVGNNFINTPKILNNPNLIDKIKNLNNEQTDIFFAPNAFDGSGRKKENCTGINALFVDIDEGSKQKQLQKIEAAPLPPSFVVETKRGFHIYYLVEPNCISIDKFSQITKRLIAFFNGDPQCTNPTRLLRMPHFKYWKDGSGLEIKTLQPLPRPDSRIPNRYSLKDITDNFPQPSTPENPEHTPKWKKDANNPNLKSKIEKGRRNSVSFKQACSLLQLRSPRDPLQIKLVRAEHEEWAKNKLELSEGFTLKEVEDTFNSALKYYKNDELNLKKVQNIAGFFLKTRLSNVVYLSDIKSFFEFIPNPNPDSDSEKDQDQDLPPKYYPLSQDDLKQRITLALNSAVEKNVTRSLIGDLLLQIKMQAPRRQFNSPQSLAYIRFDDCLLNTNTLKTTPIKEDDGSIFTPNNVNSTFLDGNPDKAENFFKYLDFTFGDEPENIQTLKHLLGYYLLPEKKPHLVPFFYGLGGTGKSTLAKLLTWIFPNYTNLRLEDFANNFALSELLTSKLNISNEDEGNSLPLAALKNVSSEDPIRVEKKYQPGFTAKLITKFLVISNQLPNFQTVDSGLKRRLIILHFKKPVPKDVHDPYLEEKFKKELPHIIRWMYEGAKELRANDYKLKKNKDTIINVRKLEEKSNSALAHFRQTYIELDPENLPKDVLDDPDRFFYTAEQMYEDYVERFCREERRKPFGKRAYLTRIGFKAKFETTQRSISNRHPEFLQSGNNRKRGRYLRLRRDTEIT